MATEMTIGEHLEELRMRVVRIVISIIVITVFAMSFDLRPIDYNGIMLAYPFPDPIHNLSARITLYMQQTLLPPSVTLVQTAPGQAFFAQIYVSALIGLIASMPIIVREIALFISPAISPRSRKSISRIMLPAVILFVAGVAFAYFAAVPFTLNFLYQYGEAIGVLPLINISDFISFVMQFFLGFGIAFELPIMMYAVSLTDTMSPKFWRNNFRYAVIVLVIFGAIITPDGSGVTMWFVAGPMIALYLVGMVAVERRAKRIESTARANT